jgi:replication factor C subunit 1
MCGRHVTPACERLLLLPLQTVPAGHPDAFTAKVFVFSGVLPSLYREQATDLVAGHGGRSTKDVSGKSSFLVVGNNCSRRKYDKVGG